MLYTKFSVIILLDTFVAELEAGWNDPPNFSYSESIQYSKSPKRNLLNKRVAFPLNSTNSSQPSIVDPTATINFNPNLPPPPSSSAVSSGENFLENSNTSCNDESINTKVRFDDNFSSSVMDDESRLNEVLKNLNDVIEIQNGLASSHVCIYNFLILLRCNFHLHSSMYFNESFQFLNVAEYRRKF